MARKGYLSAYTDRLKKEDPLKLKAQRARTNMRNRDKTLPVPTSAEIEAWLKAQPMVCAYTGARVTPAILNIDHRQPLDRGGTNDLVNLCVTTKAVNGAKGNMTEGEFRSLLALTASWDDNGKKLLSRLRAAATIFAR